LFLSFFLPLFSPVSFCFSSVFCSLPSLFHLFISLFLSLVPGIYKREREERELLPLSSHGAGVGWLGQSVQPS
jgi:hypothetical protein